jgi:hypothetical protein
MKKILISFLILLFIFSGPIHFQKAIGIDYSLVYDFIASANLAKWYGSFGELPFPGTVGDRTGYALWKENASMEDRVSYSKVLEVHPDVKDNGYIRGVYPLQTIPEKSRLNVSFGFLMSGSETSGVTYTINFQVGRGQPIQLFQGFKTFTKQLTNDVIDLSPYQGKTGNIILMVSAIKPSPTDLSAWVRVTMEKEKPEEALPDLTISNIRVDQGKIYYTLKNIGSGKTPELRRGQFIQNMLSLDGVEVLAHQISVVLKPGEETERMFPDYLLPKSKREQVLKVCADSLEFVKESNERNNCTEKIVPAEPAKPPEEEEPLKFLRPPQVSAITTTSARFTWLMNNDSSAVILYDTKFRVFGSKQSDPKFAKIHDITLANLKPGTLYEFYVQCVDKNGSIAKSANSFFKTLTEPLKSKPTLHFTLASELTGKISIKPILSDLKSFSRVRLYVDNHPVFTNFAEPYTLELDTKKYANGVHEFKLQGFDVNGAPYVEAKEGLIVNKDLKLNEGPLITVLTPINYTEFPNSTAVIPLKATIDHKQKYDIHHLEIFIDGNLIYTAKPDKSTGTWATKNELPKTFTYDIPISYFAEGHHKVELKAFDSENVDNYVITYIKTLTPSWYKPALVLSYKTSLEAVSNTSYKVDFMITNNGNLPAKDINLQISNDILPGFIISNAHQGAEVVLYSDFQVLMLHIDELDFKNGKNVFHLYFDLSPCLKSPVNWSTDDYVIMKEVSLIYNWDGNTKTPTWENWDMANHVSNDVFWMAKSADYLIISNLKTLLYNSSPNKTDLNELFMSMAELAAKKKGIIGLMNEIWLSPETVKQKMLAWGENLSPQWFSSGYLLIVGETEIVPSFTRYFSGSNSTVPTTDYPYADTTGNEMYPELTIGRIIGDCAACLKKPIQASLDVANGKAVFRRNHHVNSNAYTLSGTGDGEEAFWDSAYWVGELLKQEFYYVGQGQGRAIINEGVPLYKRLRQRTSGLTVFFYRDHGGAWCLCNVDEVASSDINSDAYARYLNFGNSRPFVFACCCDSGKYEGIYGIANCLMENAGAYIGSTGLSDRASNNYNAYQFFKSWVNQPQKSLGQAFKEIRIFAFWNAVWNAEYQFYGDPKFGIETP